MTRNVAPALGAEGINSAARLTRRRILGVGASLAAAAVATGCQVQTTSDTPGPSAAGANQFEIKFPPDVDLPSEKTTFRVMLSGGGPDGVFHQIFEALHNEHSNITIDNPQNTWDTLNEAVTLGVRNGSAPDMFSKPTTVPMQVAVNGGWAMPLEDVVPDFETWKSQFPDTAFIPGVHVFNGKTYAWTYTSNYSQYGYYIYYDKALMAKAGVDPTSQPMTWDDVRTVAKKITDEGKGEAYGLMASGGRLGSIAMALAERAGLAGGAMNFKTGEYQYAAPLVKEAIELLLAMKSDGSIIPGMISLSHDLAISRMAEGKTGMQFEGAWVIPKWKKDNPKFDYGVAMPPTGNDKVFHHASFAEGTAAPIVVYAKTKHAKVAGALLSYMGSVDGQVAFTVLSDGRLLSEMPEANEKAAKAVDLPEAVANYRQLAVKLLVRQPMPEFVNPDIGQVTLQRKAITPNINDIVQGAFTGQVKNLDQALQKLQDASNKDLDQAIAAAKKKGVKVSREDFVFPNWDPEKDYTADDYKQR